MVHPEVDAATVINECVEIAGRMSTDESGAYINGALGALAKLIRN
jgi:transcription termination factor NusB